MARIKQQDTATCPRYGVHEDTHHVLQCDGAGAQLVWHQSLTKLDQWLTDHGTNLELASQLLAFLYCSHSLCPSPRLSYSLIGWHNLFERWIASDIFSLQQEYYSTSNSLRTGKRWVTELIKKNFGVLH
jgi:hypothetical protein